MTQLQDLQFPIDQAIFAAVLDCLPDAWTKAKLEASMQGVSAAGTKTSVRIDALGQPGLASVSDELQGRVRELFLVNERFKTDLRGISYEYAQQPDGSWSFAADYQYA